MAESEPVDYSVPVHQSLMEKHQLFGIGEKAFYGIVMVTLILCSMISFWCIVLGIVALLACKMLCKNEPQLMEFILQNIQVQDRYRG